MTKRDGARWLVQALLLPGAALVLASVCEADFIFHVANYTYLHEEDLPTWNRLHSGDFNGDDLPDFVMGAWVSNTEGYLEVFLGNGDGTFQALDHVATKDIWVWAVGDFDNNGLDDVLIKDYDGYTLGDTAMCYLSIGEGQFADPVSVPGFSRTIDPTYPCHSDIDDYDFDGNLDLAVATYDTIGVFLGAGDGFFNNSWWIFQYGGSVSVCSGDLNDDGKKDLVGLGHGYFCTVFGNEDGTFGEPIYYNVDGPYMIGDLFCGDFDEDGLVDVGVAGGLGVGLNSLFVFLNKGDGLFSTTGPDHEYYWYGHKFFDIYFEDLDLDGHLDLGLAGAGIEEAIILPGIGDGTFDFSEPLWSVDGFGGLEYARADFDMDGDPDIAITRKDYSTQYPWGIYVIPNETIQEGVGGEEPAPGCLTLSLSCNPFTSSVAITYEGSSLPAFLEVYDITGRMICSLSDPEGASFTWDGRDGEGDAVPTGTYLVRGSVDGQASSIMVVKL